MASCANISGALKEEGKVINDRAGKDMREKRTHKGYTNGNEREGNPLRNPSLNPDHLR